MVLEIDPEVKAIVSSGYSNDPIMADCKEYGFSDMISKPYEIQELSEISARMITERANNIQPDQNKKHVIT